MVGLELLQRGQGPVALLLRFQTLPLGGIELVERVRLRRRLVQERQSDHDDARDGERRAEQEPEAHVVAVPSAGSPCRA